LSLQTDAARGLRWRRELFRNRKATCDHRSLRSGAHASGSAPLVAASSESTPELAPLPATVLAFLALSGVIAPASAATQNAIPSACSVPVITSPRTAQSDVGKDPTGRSVPVLKADDPGVLPGPSGAPSMTSIRIVKTKSSAEPANVPVIKSTGPASLPSFNGDRDIQIIRTPAPEQKCSNSTANGG
jgi:hypothetical protein